MRRPKKIDQPSAPTRKAKHELAAEYLQKIMAVSQCCERGKYNPNGTHYRAGSAILTRSALIARAAEVKKKRMED